MIRFGAPLLGGVCSIGLMFVAADIGQAANAVEMPSGHDAALVRVADNATPAWAAPATMNPDYKADEPAAAPAAPDAGNTATEAPAAQTTEEAAPPPTGGQATTEYFGGSAAPSNPAWAAEATMDPDYKNGEAAAPAAPADTGNAATEAPATEAPATQATEEAAPPPTGGQATTSYFGDSASPSNPAWGAEATMNPDYNAATAPPAAAATTAPEATAPVRDAAVETCREAVDASAKTAKLHFTEDSAAIAPDSHAGLTAIAKALKDCGDVVVEVGGHTDSVGSPEANKILSELRAKKVVDFLTAAGVDAAKLKAVGYGQADPLASNGTKEGRKLNRRVEFLVSGHG